MRQDNLVVLNSLNSVSVSAPIQQPDSEPNKKKTAIKYVVVGSLHGLPYEYELWTAQK